MPNFSPLPLLLLLKGCDGGFPYLIGKYIQDFGIVDESCFPYIAKDSPCGIPKNCGRIYAAEYGYVGGFYGGCSESAMMLELVKNGPMAVAFEVTLLTVITCWSNSWVCCSVKGI